MIDHEEQKIVNNEDGSNGNYIPIVFGSMLLQIMRDYRSGLPRFTDLKFSEILFLYNGLRPELKRKPPDK